MEIMTLTGNLLAEWTFTIPQMRPGTTHRATDASFQLGGKGINVSRILRRFGVETQALGFAGGPLGTFCSDWLTERKIPHRFFPNGEGIRPGLVVRESDVETPETTYLGCDLPVPEKAWRRALSHVAESAPDWLAISGSIPGWKPGWEEGIRQLQKTEPGIRIAVDTYGPPLRDLVRLPLDLVKINRDELDRLTGLDRSTETLTAIGKASPGRPVRNWIITDGGSCLSARLDDGRTLLIEPASIREVSPTGSGDTFLAALLHRWVGDSPSGEALAWATACASANAASEGIGDFVLPVDEAFLPRIRPAGPEPA